LDIGSFDWLALGEIIWINALLSGDNAVVIAMACRALPAGRRKWGMILGAGVAIALRILFTLIIVALLGVPYLKIVGALALLYIAVDLLAPNAGEDEGGVEASGSLLRAVGTIAVADVVMSLDNVIAIAGVAGGHFDLLIIGLAVSVPMIVAGSAVILAVMDRFPLIVWAGAALLGFVAGEMVVGDVALSDRFGGAYVHSWETTAAVTFALAVVAVGWLLRKARRPESEESSQT
jgi:YjbE family integral membrane protein